MRLAFLVLLSCFIFPAVFCAETIVLVGGGGTGGDGSPAREAKMVTPFGTEFDKAGNLYFPELDGHRVRKIDAKGILTTIGGTGVKGDSGDEGAGVKAQFNGPHHLLVGPNNLIYVAD